MSNVMRDKFEIEDKKDSSPSYLAYLSDNLSDEKYVEAVQWIVVLNVGCGQGLLSILATKVGAFLNFSLAFL